MTVKIDQALLEQFLNGSFGLDIVFENGDYAIYNEGDGTFEYHEGVYEPTIGRAYAELRIVQNDVTPFSLKHTNETDGVFRVILRYPLNGGAVPVKTKADEIAQAFKVGQSLSYGGVSLTIVGSNREPGAPEDSWYKIVLTLPYRAFLTR